VPGKHDNQPVDKCSIGSLPRGNSASKTARSAILLQSVQQRSFVFCFYVPALKKIF